MIQNIFDLGLKGNKVVIDMYCKFIKFKRWAGYVNDQGLRDEMRKMYQRSSKLLMMNSKTGAMSFVKP